MVWHVFQEKGLDIALQLATRGPERHFGSTFIDTLYSHWVITGYNYSVLQPHLHVVRRASIFDVIEFVYAQICSLQPDTYFSVQIYQEKLALIMNQDNESNICIYPKKSKSWPAKLLFCIGHLSLQI